MPCSNVTIYKYMLEKKKCNPTRAFYYHAVVLLIAELYPKKSKKKKKVIIQKRPYHAFIAHISLEKTAKHSTHYYSLSGYLKLSSIRFSC